MRKPMQPTRLHRTVETDIGPVEVQINRRGCPGEWSAESDAAMAAIVRVAVAMQRAKVTQPGSPAGHAP